MSFGDLHFRDPLERAADALTAGSQGGFTKYQASFARLQTIGGPLSLYLAARAQAAFDNLDSSEKMELGGAYAVRAYPEGEAYGDEGYVATAEARLGLNHWARSLPGQFQLIGFVDTGEVRYAHDPGSPDRTMPAAAATAPGSTGPGRSGFPSVSAMRAASAPSR